MKRLILIGIIATGLIFTTSCDKGVSRDSFKGLATTADSLSYFIGNNLMNDIEKNGLGNVLQEGTFIKGLNDAKKGEAVLDAKIHGRALSMKVFQNGKTDTAKVNFEVPYTGLNNTKDSLSYLIGSDILNNLKKSGMAEKLSEFALIKGMKDAFNKDSALISPELGQGIAKRFSDIANVKRKEEGAKFLNKISEEEGVVTLPSGLRYKIITAGNGPIPIDTSLVSTHYHGTLINGDVFDSSVERGTPAEFPVNGVIRGWTEALKLMPVGSKWKLYIPYNLAYGERGNQGIAPFETLIFDIELLEIKN